MLNSLRITKESVDKRLGALKEDFPLSDYVQVTNPSIEKYPFPHLVADNFFKEEVYQKLLKHFMSVLDRGFSTENDPSKFHPFLNLKGQYEYDGYVYVPQPSEESNLSIFFSLAWNLFFSKLFGQPTGWCTSMAYHYHPAGNRTGFVHHDRAPKTFSNRDKLSNGVIFREYGKKLGPEKKEPNVSEEMRAIALIYYLGDDVWQEGDGGETGIYMSENEPPVKLIAPKNNRMLSFQISSKSFHAFQGNLKSRSSIVQWFHAPLWYGN